MTKYLVWTFISVIILTSCNNLDDNNYDKFYDKKFTKAELFEHITKVKFPTDYKQLASADSNYISVLMLELNKEDCKKFCLVNKFKPINNNISLEESIKIPSLDGLEYLDSTYRQLLSNDKSLRLWGKGSTTKWIYIIDTATSRLYCQFSNGPRDWAERPVPLIYRGQ